jgi:hypothetical protein
MLPVSLETCLESSVSFQVPHERFHYDAKSLISPINAIPRVPGFHASTGAWEVSAVSIPIPTEK